jgi:glutamine cyclotransferase
MGFIYDAKTFKNIGNFNYTNKEGWGLTTDGKSIIMSDGTSYITYIDPT